MRIVYSPRHTRHRPRTELLYGKPAEHPERPERVEAVRAALEGTRWAGDVVPPREYPLSLAEGVHQPAYLRHLRARCAQAAAGGPEEEWFPYAFPYHRGLDTGTPLMGETLDLAWSSACVALTGADLLRTGGARVVYALCRPPGHHAAAGMSGGYCYLNNAALAAQRLLDSPDSSGEPSAERARNTAAGRVAILDLDIHHGNGTQDIFYASPEVLYCSVHGDPEWAYPPHTGFATETGTGAGTGATFNQPLPKGTAWDSYAGALDRALERVVRFGAPALVLSQGFDTFEGDRWGGFRLRAEDFGRIGERIAAVGVPVLVVLEGGYEPDSIAAGSVALLEGLSCLEPSPPTPPPAARAPA
jgi:acetoin utilization deacetylase AcuC-like enzyme